MSFTNFPLNQLKEDEIKWQTVGLLWLSLLFSQHGSSVTCNLQQHAMVHVDIKQQTTI